MLLFLVLMCPVRILNNIIRCILREYGGKVNFHLKALVWMCTCFGFYSYCWVWPAILTIQPHRFHPYQSLCIAVPFVFIPYFSKFSTLFNSKWCWLVVKYTNIYIQQLLILYYHYWTTLSSCSNLSLGGGSESLKVGCVWESFEGIFFCWRIEIDKFL